MTLKKNLIGRRAKRYRQEKRKTNKRTNGIAEDLLSKPLGDSFFIATDSTECEETPVVGHQYFDSDGAQADEFFVILDKPYRYSPDIDLDDFVAKVNLYIFNKLRQNCKMLIMNEFTYMESSNDLKFIQLYDSDKYWDSPRVKTCVCVGRDFKIHISVHGIKIPDNHLIWVSIGRYCNSVKGVHYVLEQVQKYDICCGNQDRELQDLIPVGTLFDVTNDYKFQGFKESFYIGSTIRGTKCSLLINTKTSTRCENCNTYRRTLRKTLSRRQNTPELPPHEKDWMKSKAPDSKLTGNQMFYKVKQLKQYSSQLEMEVARLKREVKKKKTVTKGVVLSDREVNEIIDLMENSEREVYHSNPDENSGDLWE